MTRTDDVWVYDGSFDGFLCVVFEAYRRKESPAQITTGVPEDGGGLLGGVVVVETDAALAHRVARGLDVRAAGVSERLYHAWLSEADGVEMTLFHLARALVERGADALEDWRFEPALAAHRLAGRVWKETHRMHAFVRFERRAGDHWIARVRPAHHVLPLAGPHFEARYPALRWAIVDAGRGLALVHTPAEHRQPGEPATLFVPAEVVEALPEAADEAHVQRMWQAYFRAVNIPERRNLELQRRHMPRRYWSHLTEKREAA